MAKSIDSLSKPTTETPVVAVVEPVKAEVKTEVKTAEVVPSISTPLSTTPGAIQNPQAPAASSQDSYETLFPEPSVAIESPPQWIWWILLLIASAVVGLVGYRMVTNKVSSWIQATPTPSATASGLVSPSPSLTPAPTPTPSSSTSTPSPTPATTTKSNITLRVLNGTTTAGAASVAKSTLEKNGFTVRTVGNALHQNYLSTIIYYKTGNLAEAQLVQQGLTGYSATLQESTELASPDQVLVVVAPN
jgi:hypothetical protein